MSAPDGRELDVDYSRTFIMHHTEIINRGAEVLAGAEHGALRGFAQEVIDTQSGEIPRLQVAVSESAHVLVRIPEKPANG